MHEWSKVLLVVSPSSFLLVLFFIFLRRRFCIKKTEDFPEKTTRAKSLQSGIDKLHLGYDCGRKKRAGYHYQPHHLHLHRCDDNSRKNKSANDIVWRSGLSGSLFFDWDDNPSLVSEAVENGWAKFAFVGFSSFSSPATVWGLCGCGIESDAEITWEIGSGSADYMQRIRLNPKIKKNSKNLFWVSSVRAGLPLPGPPLGGSSFPQEAYLEITVLSRGNPQFVSSSRKSFSEGDRTRLISEATMKGQCDDHVNSNRKLEELKFVKLEENKDSSDKLISLGLAGGSAPPFRYPGSYPGSIGYNSTGLVYLDGKIENKSGKYAVWGEPNMVIGMGFDPEQKRVFFTLDSELVHTVYCKSEVFSSPLFPTLAANFEVTVLVNLGQCPFRYSPGNIQRTTNPCFLRPFFLSGAADELGSEDSRELFSMGRIDSQWRHPSAASNKAGDDDEEMDSETDLFEIILDDASSRR